MPKTRQETIQLVLRYSPTPSSPGAFGGYPLSPEHSDELLLAIRDLEPDKEPVFPDNPTQFQVHLGGTAAALEELGKYLVALSRSPTADPEPYESLNEVRNADGGTIRLIVRRLPVAPVLKPRTAEYKGGVCGP